jgi:drug/metabolite transporter (DMT)-like permease
MAISLQWVLIVMLVGLVGYGIAYGFFLKALGKIGAAQAGSLISLVPFFGSTLGIVVFHEPLTLAFVQSLLLVALGTACIVIRPAYPATGKA